MRTQKIGLNVIKFYDDVESLPIKRHQRFSKFLMIDNDIGDSFADYNKRTLKAISYLKHDKRDDAIQELSNRRQMVYNSFMEYSPRGRALALLVYSINGKVYKDISSSGLDKVLDDLDMIGFNKKLVDQVVDEVKKKPIKNLYYRFLASFQREKSTETIVT